MSSTPESSDPYLYPGTNVLKNLRGLTDPELLECFEARRTHLRIAELIENPLLGGLDLAHLKAIHRYIFQDVYEWAGQFRTVNISKGGHLFGLATFLERSLQQILIKLAAENHLVNLNVDTFADRCAYFLGELNASHPFREGNGRTQREFIRELGLKAGHYIDWRATTAQEMIDASQLSHRSGDPSLVREVNLQMYSQRLKANHLSYRVANLSTGAEPASAFVRACRWQSCFGSGITSRNSWKPWTPPTSTGGQRRSPAKTDRVSARITGGPSVSSSTNASSPAGVWIFTLGS
jgi:cell filamentation protein